MPLGIEIRPTRVPPMHKSAARQEAVSPDDMTVEQWVLQKTHVQHLGEIPLEVARQIVVIDALDFALAIRERVALVTYGLWAVDGDFNTIERYVGLKGYSQINPLIDSVLDNSQSLQSNLKLGDCAKEVSEVEKLLGTIEPLSPRDNQDRERLKAIVEEMLRLQGDGVSDEEILAMKAEIQQKTRLKPRAKT